MLRNEHVRRFGYALLLAVALFLYKLSERVHPLVTGVVVNSLVRLESLTSQASGVVVAYKGHSIILSANHFCKDALAPHTLTINLFDKGNDSVQGTVVKQNLGSDLCLIDPSRDIPEKSPIRIGSYIQIASKVNNIGFASGALYISQGYILGYDGPDYPGSNAKILDSAETHPGMSGGPVINEEGELIGIVDAVYLNIAITNGIFVSLDDIKEILSD